MEDLHDGIARWVRQGLTADEVAERIDHAAQAIGLPLDCETVVAFQDAADEMFWRLADGLAYRRACGVAAHLGG